MAIATINPCTGETEKSYEALSEEEVERCIERASTAFSTYRLTTFSERATWMVAAAEILEREVEDIARVMVTEMGKTLVSARAETLKCATACRFFARESEGLLADHEVPGPAVGARRAFSRCQPLGPVLAVMPWNFPLWQAMRFASPALMAGNVGLLKHASNVPQTALFMEDLFRRAGFPSGVFQTLLVGSGAVESILRDDRVKAATLTGSGPAGQAVAAIAGSVVKPTVLELGGSDPFIVMPSADLAKAAEIATKARCQNNGQSCISAKRFIVHDDVAEEFERLFVAAMSALRVGDPMEQSTDIGPLATEQGRVDVEELVADAVAHGARVLCGGSRAGGPGWFYPPTVVADVTAAMRLYREEAFGPIATLLRVADIDEAIEVANATEFGLGSNAWTNDIAEQDRFARDIEAGAVFINGMTTSYPELPFGGVKASGYGRELSSEGIRAFCNVKTVWVA